ncbi:BspA family leucine-rich repeat surface protein [Helicobacter sp. MIT 00-7814]|uniref:BspA family leucine-rich repeat surface protein n=1 Tax=unclassified Helicobacter TaxID=2593540 RepID=UPI000E1F6F1E|nr:MULTISPECIES: BspA family leucine-rich repeat surface protein [unclassified Helicobacter]RDU55496.1 BspA family leucine-rich repeat surface protein [Helicobacter sp. MIT 99-10781]RDU55585.1 BspA family leucine-rich repeat surface protein [Helicobacter sp. MIT 00-7814]
MAKYKPTSKEELQNLVNDESIYLGDIDTSAITDMSELFKESKRKDFSGIETWDVSNVTNMKFMFAGTTSFNQPLDSWDVSSVTDMSLMFADAKSFNQPLNSWDISNVTNMKGMFAHATSFNQPLNNWNTSNVAEIRGIFMSATSFNQPLDKWNVSKVMDMALIFKDATNFNQNLESWNVKAISAKDMFESSGMQSLPSWFNKGFQKINGKYKPTSPIVLKVLAFDEDVSLADIDTSAITNMSELFKESKRKDFSGIETWDVSNVTDMSSMFENAEYFNQPLDNWDVSSVTDMNSMFMSAKSFNQPLNNWNVSSVTDMQCMFAGATSFNQPLDKWDVSSVTDMGLMFSGVENFNQPLNKWNVSSVTGMTGMFKRAKSFNQPLNNWDTSNVAHMSLMFSDAASFNQPLNKWNVSSVINMGHMFAGATSFNQPLNKWNVSKVLSMKNMFEGATSFKQDDISSPEYKKEARMKKQRANTKKIDWKYRTSTRFGTILVSFLGGGILVGGLVGFFLTLLIVAILKYFGVAYSEELFFTIWAILIVLSIVGVFYGIKGDTYCESCGNYFCWKLVKTELLSENIITQDEKQSDGSYRRVSYKVGEEKDYYRCKRCGRNESCVREFKRRI